MSDIVSFGPEELPQLRRRRVVVAGAVVLVAGLAIAGATRDRPKPFPQVPPPVGETSCGCPSRWLAWCLSCPAMVRPAI